MDRILLHSDMNNYFASVECIGKPELRKLPMAVCGDPETRHGIVLAKNEPAKELGIITGESIYTARRKVPGLKIVTADFSKYMHYTKLSREIYQDFSGEVIPYGLDEAWLDLTGKVDHLENAVSVADKIRNRMKAELDLTVSIGVSYNYIFSKLASDMKKPDATTLITKSELKTKVWNLPAFELLFVGPATRKKLHDIQILTIGDLANANVRVLVKRFGKVGYTLWQFANGNDSSFQPKVSKEELFKSIGNTITLPKDLQNEEDILSMLYILSNTVSLRLKKHDLKAKCISIQIKKNNFELLNRQTTIDFYTNNTSAIYSQAKKLLFANYLWDIPIRSIGIHTSNLQDNKYEQLTFFGMEEPISSDTSCIIKKLKAKLGDFSLEKSVAPYLPGLFSDGFLK